MRVWIPIDAARQKYGNAWAAKIASAAGDLGAAVDVSGKTPEELRAKIHAVPVSEPHVLIGGYDLLPPFTRTNPTLNLSGDDDETIPTDAPYGATPDVRAEEYAPPRIVARIPDATGTGDPADFVKLLRFQSEATAATTPTKRFEECAAEFIAAASMVAAAMSPSTASILQSPPAKLKGPPDVISRLTGSGRVHVLLHGANFSPDWAYLYGKADSSKDYPRALSARQIDLCDLRGAVITFSSCYAAMLDSGDSEAGRRSESNQVALACLGHGAKCVIAATRSNWIAMAPSPDGFGPGLIAEVWRQLRKRKRIGAAFRDARVAYVKKAMSESDAEDRPYIFKTALQMQLYGNPEARL